MDALAGADLAMDAATSAFCVFGRPLNTPMRALGEFRGWNRPLTLLVTQ